MLYLVLLLYQTSFEVSIPIQSGKQSVFLKSTSLNDLLKNNNFNLSIDSENIFEMVVVEFNDYEEVVDAVSKSEFVQKSVRGLEGDDKQRELMGFARSFVLRRPTKNKDNWTLSFV